MMGAFHAGAGPTELSGAIAAYKNGGVLRQKVYELIRLHSCDARHVEWVAVHKLHWTPSIQSAQARITELKKMGWVRDSGRTSYNSGTDAQSIIWEATPVDEREAEAAKWVVKVCPHLELETEHKDGHHTRRCSACKEIRLRVTDAMWEALARARKEGWW